MEGLHRYGQPFKQSRVKSLKEHLVFLAINHKLPFKIISVVIIIVACGGGDGGHGHGDGCGDGGGDGVSSFANS